MSITGRIQQPIIDNRRVLLDIATPLFDIMSSLSCPMTETRYTVSMDGRQIRAARALMGWTQGQLCRRAKISRPTLMDLENDTGDPRRSSIQAVEDAFRAEGVILSDDGQMLTIRAPKKRKT